MKRRVGLALLLAGVLGAFVARPSASARSLVPASVEHKIAALFGPTAYVPGWLPHGFVYIGWKPQLPTGPHGSVLYGRFTITFARAGKVLLWRMDDPNAAYDCKSSYANARATIDGRHVFYVNGNHGQSGVYCFGHAGSRYELSTWDDHVFPPSVEMEMAARAVLAR